VCNTIAHKEPVDVIFLPSRCIFVVIRLSFKPIFSTFLHPQTIPDHPNKKASTRKKISDGGFENLQGTMIFTALQPKTATLQKGINGAGDRD
jgi:hypothetical protein